jgi:hypothetical protein
MRPHFQNNQRKMDVAQAVELLLCKHEALSSKKKKRRDVYISVSCHDALCCLGILAARMPSPDKALRPCTSRTMR